MNIKKNERLEHLSAGDWNILFELKETDESSHLKDALDVIIDVAHNDFTASGLGAFQNAEQDAESAGSNILQTTALDNHVLAIRVVEWFQHLLGLNSSSSV